LDQDSFWIQAKGVLTVVQIGNFTLDDSEK
jgi:hypothetical protein